MDINQLTRPSRGPKVGEIRMHMGKRSMCINSHVQYAGGEGPLWATEDMLMEFTLRGHHRYFRGYCRDVSPKTKTVLFTITEGKTWGKMAQGSTVGILASRFTRCHMPDPDAPNLVDETKIREAALKAKLEFANISLERIIKDVNFSLCNRASEIIGIQYYQELASVIIEYNNLQLALMESERWYSNASDPIINQHKWNLIRAIKASQFAQGQYRDEE